MGHLAEEARLHAWKRLRILHKGHLHPLTTGTMTDASIDQASLDRGFFHFSIPYIWWMWLIWGLGLALAIAGFVFVGMGDVGMFALSGFGFLMLAFSSPGSLEAALHNVRKNAISSDELEAQAKERGYEMQSWWLQRSSYAPTNDPNDWILSAPGPTLWNKEDIYAADESGEPLAEHPHKVGTPRPATMSAFGLFSIASIGCFLFWTWKIIAMTPEELAEAGGSGDPALLKWIMPILGIIGLLVGWYQAKMLAQMLDTPTSLIRSMAVGSNELVGQVRPAQEGDMTAAVGGAPHRTVHNMVAYKWTHEVYECRTTGMESSKTTVCDWRVVEQEQDSNTFMLHDGTGGIRILSESFKRWDWGNFLKRWESKHDDTIGKELFGQMASKLMGQGKIKKHRWTLWGLRIGNPVYVMGNTIPRSREEAEAEGCDASVQHTLLNVNGEDAPGVKTIIRRGTELSNLGTMRSGFEMVIIPAIMLLGGITLFLV